jgi:thiol-disulfide isomerase/thioredoxin
MDRLPALIALVTVLCACDGGGAAANSGSVRPQGRVNAVMASNKSIKLGELRDIAPEPARNFTWPELAGPAPARESSKYRWVNVWATWCKPCVEEMPLLQRTFAEWKHQNQNVALTLVSVDADADAATKFVAARADLPATHQLKDASAAGAWLGEIGLASGAAIPVHIVLDDQDRLLCARSGGISQPDLDKFHRALFP